MWNTDKKAKEPRPNMKNQTRKQEPTWDSDGINKDEGEEKYRAFKSGLHSREVQNKCQNSQAITG